MPDAAPKSDIRQRFIEERETLRQHDQLRSLAHIEGVNLCSNDYLGIAGDERLQHVVAEAALRGERVGSAGSRLLSGNAREWEELERDFAAFAGTESALYFSSGYNANLGLLGAILERG